MDALKITLTPQTAFGTPLVGDTLFGHLCWNIAEAFGAVRLRELLHNYCDGKPFLIASDAFPAGHLPLPTLPSAYWTAGDETDRKKLKKKQWLPLDALTKPVRDWQRNAKSNDDIAANLISSHSQAHNRINRAMSSTGDARFAPFTSEQNWYGTNSQWQLYLLHDPARITRDELAQILKNLGHSGYGRDASTGLGDDPRPLLPTRPRLQRRTQLLPNPDPLRPPRQRASHRWQPLQKTRADGTKRRGL